MTLELCLVQSISPYCCKNKSPVSAKILTWEIVDFTPSAHALSDIPGHAFRKRLLAAVV